MAEQTEEVQVRPANELDISDIVLIDEKIGGAYRPEVWERRIGYYLRRDPDAPVVAESGGKVVGFMLGEVRSGDFGLEHATGWIEVLGVDPDFRGKAVGRLMAEAMLAHFRDQGATEVHTLVDTDQMGDVAGFFRSLGFDEAPLTAYVKSL